MTDVIDWWGFNENGRSSISCSPFLGHAPQPTYSDYDTNLQYRNTPLSNQVIPNYFQGSIGLCHSIMPTPPRSPPMEYELDELVATIPEILESSSIPSDIKNFREILNDIEATSIEAFRDKTSTHTNSYTLWDTLPSTGANTLLPEDMLKEDIMWGEGSCSTSPTASMPSPPLERKPRLISESDDARLPDPMKTFYFSDDEEEHLPETPSGSDTDGDDLDLGHLKLSTEGSTLENAVVNIEHNYCGRPPHNYGIADVKSPSPESDDEVDVVTCCDRKAQTLSPAAQRTTTTTTTTTTTKSSEGRTPLPSMTLPPPPPQAAPPQSTMISPEVKRQLQITIHESMKNKQRIPLAPSSSSSSNLNVEEGSHGGSEPLLSPPLTVVCSASSPSPRLCGASGTDAPAASSSSHSTQGKPAAYTKRMREYHSEVLRTNKRKRPRSGESDEGRRCVHNTLERQRRVDLRTAFENLRHLVPDTRAVDKAPKVQILRKASHHCRELQLKETSLIQEREKLANDLEMLKQRLAELS